MATIIMIIVTPNMSPLEVLQLTSLPFVQRAAIGGISVAILSSTMGVLVVLRRSAFFGDAIAHASLTGVALGLLLGWQPLLMAAVWAVMLGFGLPWLEKSTKLPMDSLLGLLLPFSMAIGVLLLTYIPGYQPELVSYLFGSLLSISWTDIGLMVALTVVALGLLLWQRRQLLLSSIDPDFAQLRGINVARVQTLYQVLLALTVVVAVQVVGVVLINALLIVPTATAKFQARSLRSLWIITPLVAVLATTVGLGLSLAADWPLGPSITLVMGVGFGLSWLSSILKRS